MDLFRIAARVIARKSKPKHVAPPPNFKTGLTEAYQGGPQSGPQMQTSLLKAGTEYSCRAELHLTVDFEGDASKRTLEKKFRTELLAAVKQSVEIVAKELRLQSGNVSVRPIRLHCVVNDQDTLEDDEDR